MERGSVLYSHLCCQEEQVRGAMNEERQYVSLYLLLNYTLALEHSSFCGLTHCYPERKPKTWLIFCRETRLRGLWKSRAVAGRLFASDEGAGVDDKGS